MFHVYKPHERTLKLCLGYIFLISLGCHCLNNGLALKPPMGWLAWERFRCNTDCDKDPNNCVNQKLFMEMADRIVQDGFKDVGYEYINIDDCWMLRERDKLGNLVPDPTRFPDGIKFLADYMHKRGLKLGIYEDYGRLTCMGYPGIVGHMQQDANKFASWDVDYLKLDGCHSHPMDMDKGYVQMGNMMKSAGKTMVYSCSWPYYQFKYGMEPNYSKISNHCNLWRNFDDIQDSWSSILSIIDFFGDNQEVLVPHAGPGHWNDPDMIIIGNFGLSYDQSKVQMAMWAIFAAPLLMSNDLRKLSTEMKNILINPGVIAINQDPLGIQGKRVFQKNKLEVWLRPLSPVISQDYSYAIAFLNRRTDGLPARVKFSTSQLGLNFTAGYRITDAFSGQNFGILKPSDKILLSVNPTGITLLRANLVL